MPTNPFANSAGLDAVQITYAEAAEILAISPRAVRDVLKNFADVCPATRYGHRTVRFPLSGVMRVLKLRREAALRAATRTIRLAPRAKNTKGGR